MGPPSANTASAQLLARGATDCSTEELLAILLRGDGADGDGVDVIAQEIDAGKLRLAAATPDALATAPEFEPATVATLMASFELARRAGLPQRQPIVRGPEDVAGIARRELGGRCRERVIVIVCDAANRHLRTVPVSDGAVDRSLLPVREILNAVVRCDGRAFAVAHNHPFRGPEPSDADIAATRQIQDAAGVLGLRFLGHVVVGPGVWAVAAT